ncbi:Hypp8410 [Branchiostoma lanceolatum]|uniref:Hypp8410 protein n=1 Tax=Branchiostoma lanceolatum TaxID=7740 RepID=A0A8J9Z6P1_BRALA|nr:Hypp8410 [Branchiostoma lanceolatum]
MFQLVLLKYLRSPGDENFGQQTGAWRMTSSPEATAGTASPSKLGTAGQLGKPSAVRPRVVHRTQALLSLERLARSFHRTRLAGL